MRIREQKLQCHEPGQKSENHYHLMPILEQVRAILEGKPPQLDRKLFEKGLEALPVELVMIQHWIKHVGYRLVLGFEGCDTAGQGGTTMGITERLNPRSCKVVALRDDEQEA